MNVTRSILLLLLISQSVPAVFAKGKTATQTVYCEEESCSVSHQVGNKSEALYYVGWCRKPDGSTFDPYSISCGSPSLAVDCTSINVHTCFCNQNWEPEKYEAKMTTHCDRGELQPEG